MERQYKGVERRFKDKRDDFNDDPIRYVDHIGTDVGTVRGSQVMIEPPTSYYLYKDERCGKIIKDHNIVRRCPDCDKPKNNKVM